jgi:hypothetical protein
MSKVKIQGNSSGTGVFTIEAPNSNTDRTLTLPDNAGEVLTNASSLPAANLTGNIPAANLTGSLPAIDGSALTGLTDVGKVVQIQETIQTTQPVYTNFSYNDLGLSVNITPTSSSNKILVFWNVNFGGGGNSYCAFRILRNGTFFNQPGQTGTGEECHFGAKITDDYTVYNCSGQFFDTPNTTSQVTYNIQGSPKRAGSGNTLAINRSNILGDDNQFRVVSSITVMEIAA